MIDDDIENDNTARDEERKSLLENEDLPMKRGVNAFQLAIIIYFFTSGGPFGIESAVGAAGPLLTFIAVIVIPIVWSFPQALMSAELSLMISENGGNVLWVHRAFGGFVGWINAWNGLFANLSSMSLLVIIFVEYLAQPFSHLESWMIKLAFISFITLLNIIGLRFISRLSVPLLMIILSPFVVQFFLFFYFGRFQTFDYSNYLVVPPVEEIQWGVYLSTTIWCFGGFDQMGSMAGEVKGGRRTFIKGIAVTIPFIIFNYLIPLLLGVAFAPSWENWTSGYFTHIAFVSSRWLGIGMIVASMISNFGQYNATMATQSRIVWVMAQGKGCDRMLPKIVGWSWRRHTGTVRPIGSIIFVGFFSVFCVALPFNSLVQVYLVLRIVNLMCEWGAVIRLRDSEPNTNRPFVVPGGKIGIWTIYAPTVILSGASLVFAEWEVWIAGIGFNLLVILVWLARRICLKCRSEESLTPNIQ